MSVPKASHVELPIWNEQERLKALASFSILDTSPEPVFDSLTELGAQFFHAPICVIALIDENRQVFKSAYGTDIRETLRERSFCNHALGQDDPTVVLDATKDPRFAQNPYVLGEPFLRFYAGAPLVSREGHKLGTFCIFDTAPRDSFSAVEREALKRFAFLTFEAIEQRLLPKQVARAEKEAGDAERNVRQILESVPQSVFLLNENWELTFLNDKAVQNNANGRNLLGANLWETFPGLVGTVFEERYRQARRDHMAVSFEEFYPRLNTWFKAHVHPVGNGLAVFLEDVTEQHVVENALQKAEERYRLATQSPTEGIWDWDKTTGEAYFSARWQEILGLAATDTTGPINHLFERVHPRDIARLHEYLAELEAGDASDFTIEMRLRHESGDWHWIRTHGTVVRDSEGHIVRMAGCIGDITDTKFTDPLTGLHNRASLLEKIEQRMESSTIIDTFAVMIADLTRFKRINDCFGQRTGDEVLIEVARRLDATLQRGTQGIVARLSGDEFAILLLNIPSAESAVAYADHVRAVLAQPIACSDEQLTISASIGIAMGDEGYVSPEKILEDADVAMHQAKESGKDHHAVFGAHMRESTRRRIQLELDLREAVKGQQLMLQYQPTVLLQTGKIFGFEALLRWQHPTRGMISPADFIPYAEESGLIVEIGHWTLREAIRQLMQWRSSGLVTPDLTMSVNLSTKQFEDHELTSEIKSALSLCEAPAECLALEITESALIGNMARAKEILDGLRQVGVCLAMDDFGTGYSSLNYLHRLPFHTLKIDQSFIREVEISKESRAIARSIIQLGNSLNMRVIAEGVETIRQKELLGNMGCLYGQGYLFSKPLPAAAMEDLLRTQNQPAADSATLATPRQARSYRLSSRVQ